MQRRVDLSGHCPGSSILEGARRMKPSLEGMVSSQPVLQDRLPLQ